MSKLVNIKILPDSKLIQKIQTDTPARNILLQTTIGDLKLVNEDRIGYSSTTSSFTICLSDGHWGSSAAEAIATYFVSQVIPDGINTAQTLVKILERQLWRDFGSQEKLDATHDRPPEASFCTIWYDRKSRLLTVASYGDVRCALFRPSDTINIKTEATWLGAFSFLGLRDRLPIDGALQFGQYAIERGTRVALYSDGVDECIYETPTILESEIEATVRGSRTISNAADDLFKQVFAYGAEDNASIVIAELD